MLLRIKGDIKPFHCQDINVFSAPLKEHSVKPLKSYELIEEGTKTIKDCKTLEIFARKQYRDWVCIGFALDGLDIYDSLDQVSKR